PFSDTGGTECVIHLRDLHSHSITRFGKINYLIHLIMTNAKIRRKAKGGVRKAKYRFKDENGEIREWSGNGKRPLALQKLLDEG
ncbi:hypothetical protein ACSLN1_25855, partial [Escherichia coli]